MLAPRFTERSWRALTKRLICGRFRSPRSRGVLPTSEVYMTKVGVSNVAIVDVRRGHAIKRLGFSDCASAQRFCDLCDLYAQESGNDFGGPDAYWVIGNRPGVNGSRDFEYSGADADGVTTELDETVLADMISLLWSHRTGRASPVYGVSQIDRLHGGITFGGAALPEMRQIRVGDAIIVIRKLLPTIQLDDDLKGIVVGVDAGTISYVRTKHVTSTGHINKDAHVSLAAQADVRFHPEAEVTSDMVRKLVEVKSPGDLLLRPIRYGADVLLSAWFRQQAIFPGVTEDPENARDLRVTYRGRMRDCTGRETDRGVMLEFEGKLADVTWQQIASLKPAG